MSKGIVSNRGGGQVTAGTAEVVRDEVTGITGTTVTFTKKYSYGSDGAKFYRNGLLMDKVASFAGSGNNGEEYQEVNNGQASTQITLNSTDPATTDELFTMVYIKGISQPTETVPALDVDWSTANYFTKSIAVNSTFTFSNELDGQEIKLLVTNSSGGAVTITWPTVVWPAGTADTTVNAGEEDLFIFFKSGSTIYARSYSNMS
jgi:hypothetical protein